MKSEDYAGMSCSAWNCASIPTISSIFSWLSVAVVRTIPMLARMASSLGCPVVAMTIARPSAVAAALTAVDVMPWGKTAAW
jgi:hypothetical protein